LKRGALYRATGGQLPINIVRRSAMADETDRQDKPDNAPTAPAWDPDRDGKPGISWPAAAILIVLIVGVVLLALNGLIDVKDLIPAAFGALSGGAAVKLRKGQP
jgi:hypothetical protein